MVKSGVARWLGFVLVAVSTVFPLTLLAVMSFSREWFYPALAASATLVNSALLKTVRPVTRSDQFAAVHSLGTSSG